MKENKLTYKRDMDREIKAGYIEIQPKQFNLGPLLKNFFLGILL